MCPMPQCLRQPNRESSRRRPRRRYPRSRSRYRHRTRTLPRQQPNRRIRSKQKRAQEPPPFPGPFEALFALRTLGLRSDLQRKPGDSPNAPMRSLWEKLCVTVPSRCVQRATGMRFVPSRYGAPPGRNAAPLRRTTSDAAILYTRRGPRKRVGHGAESQADTLRRWMRETPERTARGGAPRWRSPAVVAVCRIGALVSLSALAACLHDFDAFKIGDAGSVEDAPQNSEGAAPDAAAHADGCTPSLSCLNNARTCGTGCGSNATCRSNCVGACVQCTENFSCAAQFDCAKAASP
jgi:hypothetical protein